MFSSKQRILISLAALAAAVTWAGESPTRIEPPQGHKKFLNDDPLWAEPKPRPVPNVKTIDIDNLYDFVDASFAVPHQEKRRKRGGDPRAANVNTVGEVPDSEWYSNRKWRGHMSIEDLVRGPGNTAPPEPDGKWRIISAKTDGVTPGFRIEDAHGNRYLLKFDPPNYPELASGADVIGSKVYYALGYNTPENYIAKFRRDQLVLSESSSWKDSQGKKRVVTEALVDKWLADQPRDADGRYRAMASRWLPGKPIGPFIFEGTRSDDPNDVVPHELRRELRGMAVFAAWMNDTDAKAINTLDSLVGEPGAQYVKHFRIDWGASLGSDSLSPKDVRRGHDYFIDPKSTAKQAVSFGFYVPEWMREKSPHVTGVGTFDYQSFEPLKWKSNYPSVPFLMMDNEDAFWAAKKVMTFSNEEIRALVETGEYSDPRATDWIVRCLTARRDKIGQAWLSRGLPLDNFKVQNGRLQFDDLAERYGVRAAIAYSVEWSAFDNRTGEKQAVEPSAISWVVPGQAGERSGYLVASVHGPSIPGKTDPSHVDVYLRRSSGEWTVVGIDRFNSERRYR